MMPKAAIAAINSTLLMTRNTRAALVWAGAGVLKPGLDVNVSLLPQFGEVRSCSGLQPFTVDGFADSVGDLLHRRNSGRAMSRDLKDDKTLAGADNVSSFASLERKSFLFEVFRQLTPFEITQTSALGRGRTVRTLLGHVFEFCAFAELFQNVLGLGFGFGHLS